MIFITNEQRQVLQDDDVPMPLIDADAGKCYMVMPVDFSADASGVFRATMPGIDAVAEAEVASQRCGAACSRRAFPAH